MTKMVKDCKKVLETNLRLPKLKIDIIDNPIKKVLIASPFDGDKKLHNQVNIIVVLRHNIDYITEGNCKTMIRIGTNNLVEEIIPIQNLDSKVIEYNNMVLEATSSLGVA